MAVLLPRHCITVADYHKMGEIGILSENDRVEMIKGEIIDRAPIGSAHAACVRYLLRSFAPGLGKRPCLMSRIRSGLMIIPSLSPI